jgi:hypothetical protein
MNQSTTIARMGHTGQPLLQVTVASDAASAAERSVDIQMMQAGQDCISRPLVLLDTHFRIRSANRAFCDQFSLSPNISNGTLLFTVGNHQWDNPTVRRLLLESLETTEPLERSVSMEISGVGSCLIRLKAQRRQRVGTAVELIHLSVEECLILALPPDTEEAVSAEVLLAKSVTNMARDLNRSLALIIGSAQMLAQHEDLEVRDDAENIACAVSRIQATIAALVSQARNVENAEDGLRELPEPPVRRPYLSLSEDNSSYNDSALRRVPRAGHPFLKVA